MTGFVYRQLLVFLIFCLSVVILPFYALSDETYRFERMWPTLQQPWYFTDPEDIVIDKAGYVYVVDSSNYRIQKFTLSGKFVTKWGSRGYGDGEFSQPIAIATDSEGNVYVADEYPARIQMFTSFGDFITSWGHDGDGDGEFSYPKDIAVDCLGNVYVVDRGNSYLPRRYPDRIQKFTSSGDFITSWGHDGDGDGEFSSPTEIAIDTIGNVYAIDNYWVQKFTSTGEFITKWGRRGSKDKGLWSPTGIAIDGEGNVCVIDDESFQKFAPTGDFISEWGSDADFFDQEGIAIDSSGNVYVVEKGNRFTESLYIGSRIQKFSSSGKLITTWQSWGRGDGEFLFPKGIAVDDDANVYVVDYGNSRIQKFTSSGEFITKWGSPGKEDGEFYYPDMSPYNDVYIDEPSVGIATDGEGNVYVESGNYRVQKFTSSGEFMCKWGSPGDVFDPDYGEFSSSEEYSIAINPLGNIYVAERSTLHKFTPTGDFLGKWSIGSCNDPNGMAIDDEGNVFLADFGNYCVRKFTSSGEYITCWGQFAPSGIKIDNDGNVYVGDPKNNRIHKFTSDGDVIAKFGSFGSDIGLFNQPLSLSVDSTGRIYIADFRNNRVQVFQQINSGTITKAVVVAGGGPFPGNNLWDFTQMCANFVYRALNYQGLTKDTIYYLTSDTDLDLDSNGVLDDVDGDATNSNLEYAITEWALDADSVVIYLTDHGGNGSFRMSGTETLSVTDLNAWLNTLQASKPGKVVVIYDACESGSFLTSLQPPAGKERVVITSTSPGEQAKFVTQGSVSFSNYFWTHIFNGLSIRDAFDRTDVALCISFNDQHPLMDANGNGVGNEAEDYSLTQTAYIGNGTIISGDAPVIGSVSPIQTISGKNSAPLYAASVTDDNGIGRVWAVIRPPDYVQGNSPNPVTSLPSIDLMPVGDGRYEGTYTGFNLAGTYQIAIYAMDRIGNTSIPSLTTVSVENPLRRRAIIVAGGPSTEPFWLAVETNAKAAYEALSFQGYSNDYIYFMSPVASSVGVDGLPTLSNVEDAVTRWAQSSTQDLVMYLIGFGENGTFKLNENQNISAADLDAWLDTLQSSIPGKVTVIYDACRSGSFLPLLTPPSGKERILISSTSDNESAHFLSGGDISFSKFFWNQVANGSNVREAFLHGRDAIKYSCRGQTPQMDDNGNGTGNEKADGVLARSYIIGFGIMLGGDAPIIGSVSPAQTLAGAKSATLWAENVTSINTISKVWAVIIPPDYASDPASPVTDLPTVTLTHAGGGRYEAVYGGFSSIGTYVIAIHAIDQDENVSPRMETTVSQTAGLEGCPGCGGDDVDISNKTFDSTTNCECRANKSITIGNGVTIKAGANMVFTAPKVNLKSMFKAENGARVKIKQE